MSWLAKLWQITRRAFLRGWRDDSAVSVSPEEANRIMRDAGIASIEKTGGGRHHSGDLRGWLRYLRAR